MTRALTASDQDDLADCFRSIASACSDIANILTRAAPGQKRDALEKLTGAPKREVHRARPADQTLGPSLKVKVTRPDGSRDPKTEAELNKNLAKPDDFELDTTDRKILGTLIILGGSADWRLVAVIAGFSHKTGSVGMSLARMRRAAYIEGQSLALGITGAGRAAYGPEPLPLPRGFKLFEWWCEKLGATEAKILRAVRVGHSTVREMGFTHKTGTTGMALARLKRLGFLEGSDGTFRFSATFKAATDPSVKVFDGRREVLFDERGNAR